MISIELYVVAENEAIIVFVGCRKDGIVVGGRERLKLRETTIGLLRVKNILNKIRAF